MPTTYELEPGEDLVLTAVASSTPVAITTPAESDVSLTAEGSAALQLEASVGS